MMSSCPGRSQIWKAGTWRPHSPPDRLCPCTISRLVSCASGNITSSGSGLDISCIINWGSPIPSAVLSQHRQHIWGPPDLQLKESPGHLASGGSKNRQQKVLDITVHILALQNKQAIKRFFFSICHTWTRNQRWNAVSKCPSIAINFTSSAEPPPPPKKKQ